MKFPTIEEMAQNVAEKALDEYEYKGRTIRQWIEIISASEHGTNLAEVGTDCISRQAAISAICNACGKIDCDKMDKCEKLQLPPANCSEFPNNSDAISRQAAIDVLATMYCKSDEDGYVWIIRRDAWARIDALPSAEPKRGKWIRDGHHIRCDQCGMYMCDTDREGDRIPTEFCPNCGADMRGEQDE